MERSEKSERSSFFILKGALTHHLVRANATSFTSAYMRKLIRFVALPLSHKVLRLFGSPEAMRWHASAYTFASCAPLAEGKQTILKRIVCIGRHICNLQINWNNNPIPIWYKVVPPTKDKTWHAVFISYVRYLLYIFRPLSFLKKETKNVCTMQTERSKSLWQFTI